MNKSFFFLLILVSFYCKQKEKEVVVPIENKLTDIKKDSILEILESKINFNLPPISIKDYTLNDEEFWVTSSMIDSKYLDTFCNYKDFHLQRGYNILSKTNDEKVNQLEVYVKDDYYKWNREKATEEFFSIIIRDESIKVWNELFVGMHKDSLIDYVKYEDYHEDFEVIDVYSKDFTSIFYFANNIIKEIKIFRNCSVDLQKQLFKNNNLDSLYLLSNKITPNSLKADFNGDGKEDLVYLVEEIESKKMGLIFFHKSDLFFIIGGGIEFNSRWDDMNWLDILEIDKNKEQYETVFDSVTFDVIGDKSLAIPNIGLRIREIEGSGGLLYFEKGSYKYLHQGD